MFYNNESVSENSIPNVVTNANGRLMTNAQVALMAAVELAKTSKFTSNASGILANAKFFFRWLEDPSE